MSASFFDTEGAAFTTIRPDWATPQGLYDALNEEFHFTLDACATAENAKCAQYFTPENNALTQNWRGIVFLNPPYCRETGRWIQKAYSEAQKGSTVVCLVPARTDTQYWHDYAMKAAEIRFIKGRLRFDDGKQGAPFPSAIVVFRPNVIECRFTAMKPYRHQVGPLFHGEVAR